MGALFKDARKKAGLEIPDVSKVLKIKREYLVAIENNEDYIIPAKVYVDGYKKLYANYLGINLEDVLSKKESEKKINPSSRLLFKKKYADKILATASLMLVFITMNWWQSLIDNSKVSLIDDLTSTPEEYIDENFIFPYAKEYDLKNIESK